MRYLLLLLLVVNASVYAQHATGKNRGLTVPTISKSGYQYIPAYAFADSVYALTCAYPWKDSLKNIQKCVVLRWGSVCTDGLYNMAITPEQIYLFSDHENENPNLLYWTIDIDSVQYHYVAKKLLRSRWLQNWPDMNSSTIRLGPRQDTRFPKKWHDNETDTVLWHFCDSTLRHSLECRFASLNKYIPKKYRKIVLPPQSELDKIRAKIFLGTLF